VSTDDHAEPEVDRVFAEFWADIVCPDGEWDLAQVKRELHDYHIALSEVPKVYCHVTGGRMSKPHYYAEDVIREADEWAEQLAKDSVTDLIEDWFAAFHAEDPRSPTPAEMMSLLHWALMLGGAVLACHDLGLLSWWAIPADEWQERYGR
jgi:hypothetical protein